MQAAIPNEHQQPPTDTISDDNNNWVAIDEPDEWLNFSQKTDAQAHEWESRIVIEGMHCAACALNVEKALTAVHGVLSAEINATSGRGRLTWSGNITKPSDWMRAVTKAGYRALPAADAFIKDSRLKNQRLMLWRLLVAGFCMMQVMMYALPAYTASPGEMTPDAINLLRWASWILTLPVLAFSCSPFFSNAFNDLKRRQISMDLPVTLGILITFLVSTAATFEPAGWWGSEVYFDSLTMFVFFLLSGRWIELRMRNRTAGALDALMHQLPASTDLLKADGSFERVAVRRIKIDDVIRVLPGEAFPADGTIVFGNTDTNEALLTGESRPVYKATGSTVIAGSHNLSSAVQIQVKKIGQSTRYAQIVALMARTAVDKPRLAQIADRIARPFLLIVLLAAAGAAAMLWQTDHSRAMMAAVAVLIVTCPCALSLATPAAMITVSGALARSGTLVRKMQAIEALTTIDTIVFDKTGTLTEDYMTIEKIKTSASINEILALQIASTLAQHSLHPVSRTLVSTAEKLAADKVDHEMGPVQELPGLGLTADSIYGKIKLGSAQFCDVDSKNTENAAENTMVHLVSERGWLASFTIAETLKSDAIPAISALHKNDMQVEILSGDKPQAVQRIANLVGIRHVFGHSTPQQKLKHMQSLQQQGRKVAMVGDGLNDGPVLASADVSIAMGQAVPLAQSQSDFVILSGQLAMVPHLIKQARRTMHIVKQNLIWAATYNAVCIPLAVAGMLPAWLAGLGMALSSLLVILNAARLSRTSISNLELS